MAGKHKTDVRTDSTIVGTVTCDYCGEEIPMYEAVVAGERTRYTILSGCPVVFKAYGLKRAYHKIGDES